MGPDQVFGLHPNRTPCYPRSRTRRLILSYKAHVTLVEMIRRVQVVPVSDADTVLEQNRLQVHLLVYRDFKIDNRAVRTLSGLQVLPVGFWCFASAYIRALPECTVNDPPAAVAIRRAPASPFPAPTDRSRVTPWRRA